jgi:hypothetical protein
VGGVSATPALLREGDVYISISASDCKTESARFENPNPAMSMDASSPPKKKVIIDTDPGIG